MARWEPDASGRMRRAALELFAERGYEQTTVTDIAERAGVTERTFFRYFPDKREVLFEGSAALQAAVLAAIAAAPPEEPPLATVGRAMETTAAVLGDRRDYARRRAAAIAADRSLQERELLKLATLAAAVTEALRERGVPALTAALAAEAGVAVFKTGFDRWVAEGGTDDLALCIREAYAALTGLTSAG